VSREPPLRAQGRSPWRSATYRPGGAQLWLAEGVVLVFVALLLATATGNDLARQVRTNHRLSADMTTWRQYTHRDFHSLSVSRDVSGLTATEIVCGNTSPGVPKERVQLCLVVKGAVRHGRRSVTGGWYLPPHAEDLRSYRYGCFGQAGAEGRCRP
jgi:hypothetical protein